MHWSETKRSRRQFLWTTAGMGLTALPVGAAPAPQALVERYAETLPRGYGSRAVLQAQAVRSGGRIVLTGRVLEERDRSAIEALLTPLGPVENRLEVFPYAGLGERAWAVVRAPGTDLRAQPTANSELVSQALGGDTLKLLARTPDGRWYQVLREWDGYVGWVGEDRLVPWNRDEWQNWQSAGREMILRPLPGLPRASLVVALPMSGTRTQPGGSFRVQTADGQKFDIPPGASRPVTPADTPTREAVVRYAQALLVDQPTRYLWGGTIDRALDCSGFNQTVYRLAGGVLPRDSYQQQAASRPVAPTAADWRELLPGDLVFFSEKRNRATHTGLYTGEGRFIHSSSHHKGIAQNNLLGDTEYERFLRRIYFGAGRVIA